MEHYTFGNGPEQKDPAKREAYLAITEGEPDGIFILAKSMVEKRKDGEKQTGGYGDLDIHGTMNGGHARSTAAAELHSYFPGATVVANSWVKSEGPVSYAKATAEELKGYGVPDASIETQENSYSTFTEIIELIKTINEKGWKHPVALMNEFQLKRAKALFDHVNDLHDPAGEWQKPETKEALEKFNAIKDQVKVTFVGAEAILPLMNERYAKIVAAAKTLPAWQETMDRENRGAEQIERGEYWKDISSTTILKNE